MKKLLVLILGIVLIAGVLSGCTEEEDKDTDDDDDTPTNTAPVITGDIAYNESLNLSNLPVEVEFSVNASDADGDTLLYNWTITNSTNATITTGDEATLTYEFNVTDTYTIKVVVSDGEETAEKELELVIGEE
jgi:hypothetical protein